MFNRQSALRARWRKGGLHRALFWRKQGFPNLVLARAKAKANREARKALAEQEAQHKRSGATALMESTREDI